MPSRTNHASGNISVLTRILQLPLTVFLATIQWVAVHLKEEPARTFGRFIIVPLFRLRGKSIIHQLTHVLPTEKRDGNRLAQIYETHLRHMSDTIVELIRLSHCSPSTIHDKLLVEGEEHIQEALEQGKGILLTGTHMANWFYTSVYLATLGYTVSNTLSRSPVLAIDRQLQATGKKFNIHMVYIGEGGAQAAQEAFERNEIFSVLFDISVPGRKNHSAWLRFGNALMCVDLGPAMLALQHQVPVIRTSMIRKDNFRYLLTFHKPIIYGPSMNNRADAERLTQAWLEDFTKELLVYPDQWWNWASINVQHAGTTNHIPAVTS